MVDLRVRLPQADLGGEDRGLEALGHAVGGHPVGDLRLRDGIGNDPQRITPAMQFPDGRHRVRAGHPPAVVIPPQAGQLRRIGKNHIRIIFRQHILSPQFAFGSVQQGSLGLLAVRLPTLLQLGKQGVVALCGTDQLHEAGFRPVNKFLIRQNNAKGISHIEKNGLDRGSHGRFLLMMMKIAG